MYCADIPVGFFVVSFPQIIPIHFFAHRKFKLNPFQFHCLQLKVNILCIHWFTQPLTFDIETRKFDENSLCVSGGANLSKHLPLQNKFLRISNNIFDLSFVLNACYIIFINCNVCPSCLPSSEVILLKNVARSEVENKRRNEQISKFSSKEYKYSSML